MNAFYKTVRGFLTEFLPKQKGCSDNTVQSYKYALNLFLLYLQEERHLRIMQIDFPLLNKDLILGFLDWLETHRKCGVRSRNQRLAAMRSFFKYAGLCDCSLMELGLTAAAIPQKKSADKIVGFLSEEALAELLKQPDISKRTGIRNQ